MSSRVREFFNLVHQQSRESVLNRREETGYAMALAGLVEGFASLFMENDGLAIAGFLAAGLAIWIGSNAEHELKYLRQPNNMGHPTERRELVPTFLFRTNSVADSSDPEL